RDHLQVRLPHIRTDVLELGAALLAKPTEETQQGLQLALLAYPQQPLAVAVDLVDQGQILVPLLPGDFVNPNGAYTAKVPVLTSPLHSHLHRAKDTLPRGAEHLGGLFPTQTLRPTGQEPTHGLCQGPFAQ